MTSTSTPVPPPAAPAAVPASPAARRRRRSSDPLRFARRDARERAGFTQGEIAERLGISQSMVSQLEHGVRRSADHELAYCALLGVEHADLFPPHPAHADAEVDAGPLAIDAAA